KAGLRRRPAVSFASGSGCLSAGKEANDKGENHSADDGDDDGVDHATLAGKAGGAHDEPANDGPDDADDDVPDCSVAAALHELAGNPTGNKADDDPPKNYHDANLPLRFR